MKRKGLLLILLTLMCLFFVSLSNTTVDAATYEWHRVTSTSELAIGDQVTLVYETGKKALSSISTTSTKYGIGETVTISNGVMTDSSKIAVLTLEQGASSGTYSFKFGSSYLYWTSGNSLATNASKTANTSWTISFSGTNVTIKNGKDSARKIQWNASSPRFAAYTTSQTAIQLYKKVAVGADEVTPSVEITNVPTSHLFVGASAVTLTAKHNLENPTITWASNNEEVISVSNGKLTFNSVGKATITVTVEKGDKTASASVDLVVYPAENSILTIGEALAILDNMPTGDYSPVYTVSGTVTKVTDQKYGRGTIEDEEENEIVFYDVNEYDQWTDKIAVGDVITVTGKLSKISSEERIISVNAVIDESNKASNLNGLVNTYRNEGIYTKKSNIYLTEEAVEDLQQISAAHKVSTFAGNYQLDRTTYYTNEGGRDALFMADYDGTVTNVNSGYATVTAANIDAVHTYLPKAQLGHMVHYHLVNDAPVYDYYVSSVENGIQEFYVTLDDMLADNYFDGWTYDGVAYRHTVTGVNDVFFKDFLAFAAPCLEGIIFNEGTANYFTAEGMQLVVEEKTGGEYGDYLALRILVTEGDTSKVKDGKTLSEARIYKGNTQFNEKPAGKTVITIADYAGSNDWVNGTAYKGLIVDDNTEITVTGEGNTAKYYSSNNSWRFYQADNSEITITSSQQIKTIVIVYAVGNSGVVVCEGVNISSGVEFDVNANSVVLNVLQTTATDKANGNVQIQSITIYYA